MGVDVQASAEGKQNPHPFLVFFERLEEEDEREDRQEDHQTIVPCFLRVMDMIGVDGQQESPYDALPSAP